MQRGIEGGMNGLFMISPRYSSENSGHVTSVSSQDELTLKAHDTRHVTSLKVERASTTHIDSAAGAEAGPLRQPAHSSPRG